MTELDKVIKGLECHVHGDPQSRCRKCPYWGTGKHGLSECSVMVADAFELLKKLNAFREYFADLYGTGLEIANWHQNGAMEPFDNFFDSAMEVMLDE